MQRTSLPPRDENTIEASVTDTSYSVAGKFAQDTPSHNALRPWAGGVGKPGSVQKSKNSLLSQILWCLTSFFCPDVVPKGVSDQTARRPNWHDLKK
jgi:hypothetical protein